MMNQPLLSDSVFLWCSASVRNDAPLIYLPLNAPAAALSVEVDPEGVLLGRGGEVVFPFDRAHPPAAGDEVGAFELGDGLGAQAVQVTAPGAADRSRLEGDRFGQQAADQLALGCGRFDSGQVEFFEGLEGEPGFGEVTLFELDRDHRLGTELGAQAGKGAFGGLEIPAGVLGK